MTMHLCDREAGAVCGELGTLTCTRRHVDCHECEALISEGERAPVVHLATADGVACGWTFPRSGRVGLCTPDYSAVTCPECVDAVERRRRSARRSTLHLRGLDTLSNVCGAPLGAALRTNCYSDVTCAECVAEVERERVWAAMLSPAVFHLPTPNGANLCSGSTVGLTTNSLERACFECWKAVEQERAERAAARAVALDARREQRMVDAVLAGVERLLDGADTARVETVVVQGCYTCPFRRNAGVYDCAWPVRERRGHPTFRGPELPEDCPLRQWSARVVLSPSAR